MFTPVLMATLSTALGCSCMGSGSGRTIALDEGAQDVDPDAAIWVWLGGSWSGALADQVAEDYRLRRADTGELVRLVGTVTGHVLDLRPLSPLAPHTAYVLEQRVVFDNGRRLDDNALRDVLSPRRPAPGDHALSWAWHPERHFTTGPGECRPPPEPPRIVWAAATTAQGGGDCGPGESFVGELRVNPESTETQLVSVEVDGYGVVFRGEPGRFYASDMICAPWPRHLPLRGTERIRAWAESADGQRSKPTRWQRFSAWNRMGHPVDTPLPVTPDHRDRLRYSRSSGDRLAALWSQVPEGPLPVSHDALCPDGLALELVASVDDELGGRVDLSELVAGSSGVAALYRVDNAVSLLAVLGSVPDLGWYAYEPKVVGDDAGWVVGGRDPTCVAAEGDRVTLAWVRSDRGWSHAVEGETARVEQLTADHDRVVVGWSTYGEQRSNAHVTVLDRRTGEVLAQASPLDGLDPTAEPSARIEGASAEGVWGTRYAAARGARMERWMLSWEGDHLELHLDIEKRERQPSSTWTGACTLGEACTVYPVAGGPDEALALSSTLPSKTATLTAVPWRGGAVAVVRDGRLGVTLAGVDGRGQTTPPLSLTARFLGVASYQDDVYVGHRDEAGASVLSRLVCGS